MGRQRKVPPCRRFGSVGDNQHEADARFDQFEQVWEETEDKVGRRRRVDRLAIAVRIATAMPLPPDNDRRARRTCKPLPKGCVGSLPVKTTAGAPLAGFDPEEIGPKDAKRDLPAAIELQHRLAWRGDPVSLTAAVKIMQRARAWLAETESTTVHFVRLTPEPR